MKKLAKQLKRHWLCLRKKWMCWTWTWTSCQIRHEAQPVHMLFRNCGIRISLWNSRVIENLWVVSVYQPIQLLLALSQKCSSRYRNYSTVLIYDWSTIEPMLLEIVPISVLVILWMFWLVKNVMIVFKYTFMLELNDCF